MASLEGDFIMYLGVITDFKGHICTDRTPDPHSIPAGERQRCSYFPEQKTKATHLRSYGLISGTLGRISCW